jgi:hypothetical protein
MTALATGVTVDFKGAPALAPRRQKALILAGALIPRGTLAFDHNGRAMPAAPLDITKSVALGGPFKVAGTTVDGDLYFYSSLGRPMSVSLVNGAALAISTLAAASVVITIVSGTTTANQVVAAVQAHAVASQRINVFPGGTGAGIAGVQSLNAVPRIRLLGVSMFDLDNTANASTDQTIPIDKSEFAYGRIWLVNDTTNPLDDTMVPGVGLVLDNVTISSAPVGAAQLLPIVIDEIGRSGAYTGLVCVRID